MAGAGGTLLYITRYSSSSMRGRCSSVCQHDVQTTEDIPQSETSDEVEAAWEGWLDTRFSSRIKLSTCTRQMQIILCGPSVRKEEKTTRIY